jgi:hypothetical protein
MKKLAWSAGFVVFAAVAAGDAGCSITVDSGGDSGTDFPGDDAGGQTEASTGDDAGAQPETGSADDGGVCAVGVDTGNAACDACVESSCCDALIRCDGEPAADDAGATDCEEFISCYNDCLVPPAGSGEDAGTPSDCKALCSSGHTTQGAADFQAVETCLTTNCASQCPH